MKNLLPIITITFLTILLTLFSCKKDKEKVVPAVNNTTSTATPTPTPTTSTSNLNNFFKQNVLDATQTFTIDASLGQTITGDQGTSIFIPANSFQNNSNNIVSGNITIELIEIQTQADMIWLNKTTTSNGQLLVSGGELSIKAFQNGEQLTLSSAGSVSIQMPTNNPVNMSLFSGSEDSTGFVNWTPTGTNVPLDTTGGFTFTIQSGTFSNDSLGWINCDYFYNQSNLTTLTVILPPNHDESNTSIWLFFNSIYAAAPALWDYTYNNFQSYQNSLPIGEQITIVAVSEVNGQMYSSFTPITLTANQSETISLTQTTATAFQTDLNNL